MGYVYDISSGGQNAVIDAFAEYQFDTRISTVLRSKSLSLPMADELKRLVVVIPIVVFEWWQREVVRVIIRAFLNLYKNWLLYFAHSNFPLLRCLIHTVSRTGQQSAQRLWSKPFSEDSPLRSLYLFKVQR